MSESTLMGRLHAIGTNFTEKLSEYKLAQTEPAPRLTTYQQSEPIAFSGADSANTSSSAASITTNTTTANPSPLVFSNQTYYSTTVNISTAPALVYVATYTSIQRCSDILLQLIGSEVFQATGRIIAYDDIMVPESCKYCSSLYADTYGTVLYEVVQDRGFSLVALGEMHSMKCACKGGMWWHHVVEY